MSPGWVLLLLVLGAFAMVLHARRTRGLCALRVLRGEVRLVRGKAPPAMVSDLRDVLATTDARGTIVVLRGERFARVEFEGRFTPEVQQRVRNVVGNVRLARFSA